MPYPVFPDRRRRASGQCPSVFRVAPRRPPGRSPTVAGEYARTGATRGPDERAGIKGCVNEALGADRGGCRSGLSVYAAPDVGGAAAAAANTAETYKQLNLFGDVFELVRYGLCRRRHRRHAGRGCDQRHADLARPALEFSEREELHRHEGADPRRVRRARHRGVDGERPRQGRVADRRHAGRQCRAEAGRPDHPSRRQPGAGPDLAGSGREDARAGQQRHHTDDPPRRPRAVRRQADPRDHQDPLGALASRRQEHRLHPHHLVQRADRCRPQQRDEEPEAAGRQQADRHRARPAQQPGRPARPGGRGLRRLPRQGRDRLDPRPALRRRAALQRATRRHRRTGCRSRC